MKQITSVHSISRVCTDGGKTKSRLAVTPASVLPPGSSGWSWPIVVNMEPLRIQIGWILGAPSCLGRRVSGNSLWCLPAGEESLGSLEIRATCVLLGHLPASLWPGFSISLFSLGFILRETGASLGSPADSRDPGPFICSPLL